IADMRLLRYGPAINSGVNTVRAIVYEIRAQSSVAGGQASSEVFAETFSYAGIQAGTVGQIHHR
ncbi:MAG: hypothetical protein AAFV29_01995, partial [Myxococcota bacterium]